MPKKTARVIFNIYETKQDYTIANKSKQIVVIIIISQINSSGIFKKIVSWQYPLLRRGPILHQMLNHGTKNSSTNN
jgi:uncharacterized membrane protein